MKNETFKRLYIASPNEVSRTIMASMMMCGSQDWDFYFAKKPRNCESETLKNISLIEFNSFDEFKTYKKHHTFLDFSLEHEKPMVLING